MVLVTGFEPFAGDTVNPSQLVAERLGGRELGRARVAAVVLPVSSGAVPAALAAAIKRYQPDLVISFGLAGGRTAISLERVGINVVDARIADNDGVQAIDLPILADGPAAHFATLPLRSILARWLEEGIPGELSNSAGTFICNQVLYLSLQLALTGAGHRAGFIHLPYLPEQAARQPEGVASLPLELMVRAAEVAVEVALSERVPA